MGNYHRSREPARVQIPRERYAALLSDLLDLVHRDRYIRAIFLRDEPALLLPDLLLQLRCEVSVDENGDIVELSIDGTKTPPTDAIMRALARHAADAVVPMVDDFSDYDRVFEGGRAWFRRHHSEEKEARVAAGEPPLCEVCQRAMLPYEHCYPATAPKVRSPAFKCGARDETFQTYAATRAYQFERERLEDVGELWD
jgi:hypothetical protein